MGGFDVYYTVSCIVVWIALDISDTSDMSDDGHLTSTKTPSDADSNSNSGSLFSRRYPDDLSSNSSGSKENTPSLQNNENLLSPKLPSHNTEQTILRRVFNVLSPESLKCQPKLTRKNSIDLATAEEKSNADDEWFTQKFKLNWRKEPENYQVPHRITHTNMQNSLRRRLIELRQRDQQKRKAMYNADNGIINDEFESTEIDVCGFVNDGNIKTECEAPGNNESVKEKNENPKRDLMRHEADESKKDNKAAVIQKTEINLGKRNIEDRNNETEKGIAEQNKIVDLNEEPNEAIAKDSDNKFVSKKDTFDEDWGKDLLQTGKETYENLTKHKNRESRRLLDNEADSSRLFDETTGSEEGGRSPTSLIDELLDDIAANCSGIFNYSEDNESEELNKLSERISIDNNDDDDRDQNVEDEFVRQHRKSRKRRLLFMSDDSDEDKENEGKDPSKSLKNVHNLEIDNREDIQVNETSHCKKISADDVNAMLNKSDKFDVNNQDNLSFNYKNDDYEKNIMDPTDKANDDEHVEGEKETDSSEDELEMFRKLERAQKSKKKSEYIDEEASLSGDDIGSDENDDEDQLNVYEAEEGDNDELPDDETIREQLHKQWLKQQQDEEDRKLLYWKDQLLVDGDLTEETDRTFRFKLRLAKNENANEEIDDVIDPDNAEGDDDAELCKKYQEISKWKIRTTEVELHSESTSMKKTNPLLKAASKVVEKGSLNANNQSSEQADASVCKNSLLCHRKSLSQVLNQTKITLFTKCEPQ
ncbi:Claspin [Dirofilaria immitis]